MSASGANTSITGASRPSPRAEGGGAEDNVTSGAELAAIVITYTKDEFVLG